jgi:transglutaminase/protease-like cytokinesis protein 3
MNTHTSKFLRLTLLLALLLTGTVQAALSPLQQKAMNWVNKTPKNACASAASLGQYLGRVSANEHTRALTVFTWVAKNIQYDWASYRGLLADAGYNSQDAEAVLHRRTGVCEGYANLMTALCTAAGLRSQKIHGDAKGCGYSPGKTFETSDHAWNVIQVNGKWELVDACWASPQTGQQELNYYYFCTMPAQFATSHLPEAQQWQLVSPAISMKAFVNAPFVYDCFHKQGFEQVIPITHTLIPNGAVQTVRLVRANADKLNYSVSFEDQQGLMQALDTRVQSTSDGVALRFVLPIQQEGQLHIYVSHDGMTYPRNISYRVAATSPSLVMN